MRKARAWPRARVLVVAAAGVWAAMAVVGGVVGLRRSDPSGIEHLVIILAVPLQLALARAIWRGSRVAAIAVLVMCLANVAVGLVGGARPVEVVGGALLCALMLGAAVGASGGAPRPRSLVRADGALRAEADG